VFLRQDHDKMLPVDPDAYSVNIVLFRMRRGDRYKSTKKGVLAKRSIDARRQACELAGFFLRFPHKCEYKIGVSHSLRGSRGPVTSRVTRQNFRVLNSTCRISAVFVFSEVKIFSRFITSGAEIF
jgi:hypothetical protein